MKVKPLQPQLKCKNYKKYINIKIILDLLFYTDSYLRYNYYICFFINFIQYVKVFYSYMSTLWQLDNFII